MWSYYFFMISQLVLVQCIVPSLIVRKLDKTLIAKKRQNTMDMCRIFTEENKKIHKYTPHIIKSYRPAEKHKVDAGINERRNLIEYNVKQRYKRNVINDDNDMQGHNNRRFKRDATINYEVNPALNSEDKKRIETIVDKLYDDMQDKDERVTYPKNDHMTTIAIKTKMNETLQSRRFYFAPANLTAYVSKKPFNQPDFAPFESKARWKHGIVPYYIDSKTYDSHLTETIMKAFDYFEKATCIRLQKLREKPTDLKSLKEVAWLYISNPTGIRQCVHSNEKRIVNGVQMTVFGYDCMALGDIVHEVMHVLGYSHEHLRTDRDQHISILWDNIKPGYKKYFSLVEGSKGYDLASLPYDYTSIMHYPAKAFSRNGKTTILTEPGFKIGQREGLSVIDIEKVALIYSNECVSRNKEYLLQTCPRVVKSMTKPVNVTQNEIESYFKDRLWPFGIITYKLRDNTEFSTEERENLKAVFRHIEKETCLQFRDIAATEENDSGEADADSSDKNQTVDKNNSTTDGEKPGLETSKEDHTSQIPEDEKEIGQPKSELENSVGSGSSEDKKYSVPKIVYTNPKDEFSISEEEKQQKSHIKNLVKKQKIPIKTIKKEKSDRVSNVSVSIDVEVNEKNKEALRNMNLTMKKALLKKARNKMQKLKMKRSRRQTGRRHSNSILTLKRSPAQNCVCPEPGKPSGDQALEIGAGCFNSVNDLLHFFVHVLGLDHQHNMHDRDNYLHILWNNISPDVRSEMKEVLPPAASVGFSYDYQSVMHYPWLQIKDGRTNIMYPVWNDGWSMGNWQGLSSIDVQKINLLYFKQCTERQKQESQ